MEGIELMLGLDEPATVRGVARLDAMVARRSTGEPLQYVLGRWGFRLLDLMIDRRVLIPRPETEIVAERALDELRRLDPDDIPVVVDLGTGSGAIGLSLAREHGSAEVWITDVSTDALDVARANLAGLGRHGSRVRAVEGSWFEPLPVELGRPDLGRGVQSAVRLRARTRSRPRSSTGNPVRHSSPSPRGSPPTTSSSVKHRGGSAAAVPSSSSVRPIRSIGWCAGRAANSSRSRRSRICRAGVGASWPGCPADPTGPRPIADRRRATGPRTWTIHWPRPSGYARTPMW